MFWCAVGHVSDRGVKMKKMVTEARKVVYKDGHTGFETVHEEKLCPPCALIAQGLISKMLEDLEAKA